ncbi:hypothetical protein ASPSYDRAFT_133705 [Aspergillus sydowii CBS 593.65]|uniref:Rhodopsin domain-containing protein n=1 Tax=Aspergillus sydowii CBS 593.65 TaxID=1036612 RepID=A0A1L9TE88_9EURO|nr:uncharacterized protein ASPSYDRAFT_133705 [Aspergillus sydowii CBS 593.65]OJJ57701.1 hypothetical protein ASPSYDRAFT_133705 [Aspergillus sydowii CBS 593.65]
MSTPSVDIIASWPTPDYDNPHEPLDTIIYAVNIPLMVLMTVFVGARFISRTFLVRNALGIDDWMMLIAFVLAMAMSACQLVEPRYGIGRHLYDVKYAWYPSLGKLTIAIQALFAPCSAITKISICLTYLRLFPSKTNKWFNYITMTILAGFGTSTTVTMILQCIPLSDIWAVFKPMNQKRCIDSEKFFIAAAAINSITDFMVYLWPIHYLWRVKLSLAKRIGLIICFGVGVLICIAGVIRITWQVKFAQSWDQTYNGAIIFIIVAVECNLGVVCGCLPGVRPLMAKIFPSLTSSTYNSGRAKISHGQGSSNLRSGQEYQEMHSIHVRKDIELSVVYRPVDERWDRPMDTTGSGDSEEWIFRP